MVFEQLKEILANQLELKGDKKDSITNSTHIADDLGADSLDVVEMLMSVEDEFEIEIPDEDVDSLTTVGDVVAYIQNKLGED